jgi:hypothetical protein
MVVWNKKSRHFRAGFDIIAMKFTASQRDGRLLHVQK